MIDIELEEFTAAEALQAGLADAVFNSTTKISGTYEMQKDGSTSFDQNNFTFKDKFGTLRVGRFKTEKDLVQFLLILGTQNIKSEVLEENIESEIKKVSEK